MQKKIIALAVAGLMSGAAFAQSNVTIYGIADVGYSYISGDVAVAATQSADRRDGGSVNATDSGLWAGSRIGFKGSEDLGNGLSAIFTLEYKLALDASDSLGVARQEFAGLSSKNWGTVVAGYLQTPGYNWAAKFDTMQSSGVSGLAYTRNNNTGMTIYADDNARLGNAVAYVSPNFSGFSFVAAYSFGEQDGVATTGTPATNSEDKAGVLGLSADYSNGPISVGLVYHKLSNFDFAGTDTAKTENKDDQTEWGLAGSYDFGMVKLFASYQDRDRDFGGTSTRSSYNDDIWQLGASMPIGANGSVMVQYAKFDGDSRSLLGVPLAVTADNNEADAWSIAYTHNLSKRTKAYVGYTYVDLEDGAIPAGRAVGGLTTMAGESYGRFIAGMNHAF